MRNATEIMRDRQRAIRREMDRRGISLKQVSFDSKISYSSLCGYFPGNERGMVEKVPTELPSSAVFSLFGAIPDDLLNLLAPDGWAVVRVPAGVDYDDISRGCRDYLAAKEDAHHPDSECGRDLGPTEQALLSAKVVKLRA